MREVKKALGNDRGDLTIGAVFLIIILVMLISFLLLFAKIQIQCIGIQDAVKIELNNLSALIAEDTFKAMREGNLEEYDQTINRAYYTKISNVFKQNLADHLAMETGDYKITNSSIHIRNLNGKIQYRYVAKVQFKISMFGQQYPSITRNIILTGYHNTKY